MQMDATLFLFSVGLTVLYSQTGHCNVCSAVIFKAAEVEVGEDSEEGCAYPTNKKTMMKNSKLSSRFFL